MIKTLATQRNLAMTLLAAFFVATPSHAQGLLPMPQGMPENAPTNYSDMRCAAFFASWAKLGRGDQPKTAVKQAYLKAQQLEYVAINMLAHDTGQTPADVAGSVDAQIQQIVATYLGEAPQHDTQNAEQNEASPLWEADGKFCATIHQLADFYLNDAGPLPSSLEKS